LESDLHKVGVAPDPLVLVVDEVGEPQAATEGIDVAVDVSDGDDAVRRRVECFDL